MAGRELWFPNKSVGNLKEKLVRTALRNVRSQGHPYVELREDGKKLIFFCTLCLAPCYGESNLWDHLTGNVHTKRLAAAQVTLLKPNPWPFNDGVFFFHETEEQNETLRVSCSEKDKLLDIHDSDAKSLAVVSYVMEPSAENSADFDENNGNSNMDCDTSGKQLVIPAVLQRDEVSELSVRHMGVGKISARFIEKDGVSSEFRRIWCEWLGDEVFTNEETNIKEHDFAVVTFAYNYDLGRRGLLSDFRCLLPSSGLVEADVRVCSRGRKRKSFSDTELSEALCISSGEDSKSSHCSKSKKLIHGNDDQQLYSHILSSKTMTKRFKDQLHVFSERSCDICRQRMFPDKDVAALLNMRTGKLVCSSRNTTGVVFFSFSFLNELFFLNFVAFLVSLLIYIDLYDFIFMQAFHVFHISCLIHWILYFEVELSENQSKEPKATKQPKSKTKGLKSKAKPSPEKVKGKNGVKKKKDKLQEKRIRSVFCPECQGSGTRIDGDELEKPIVPLSEIFWYKIKLRDAHKAWLKSPELLQNCSMGFGFPSKSDETHKENVVPLKLLNFYRAECLD